MEVVIAVIFITSTLDTSLKKYISNTQLNDPGVSTGHIEVKGQCTMLVNDIFRSIKLKTAKDSS